MASSASSKATDDQISIAVGHPVLQNHPPIPILPNKHEEPPAPTWCEYYCLPGVLIFFPAVFFVGIIIQSTMPPTPLPKFSVSSLSANFINATSSYQIAIDITIRKPDSDSTKTISYDNIVASLYYDDNFIRNTTLFPFKQQEQRNFVAVVKAKFTVDPNSDVGFVGVFDVRVSMDATVNDRKKNKKLDVFCEDIRVESGSMAGPMKDCTVEGSFDDKL